MTKVFKSEIDVEPTQGDQLIDEYNNVWCVVTVHQDSVKVSNMGRHNGLAGRSYRTTGKITWNPALRAADANKLAMEKL